ncbi:L-ectoine synthase [Enhygromyxa salina]|uniref:L-ectoine synthase n=1 Tax=Enhygromyxa salina TaxID=215803 RepID=A0A2S9YD29_9BACT|nr:ectoine synthase [Enhygromyxa salina]PRQ03003.1 L-ectoine synthase [Enhygromyxa salina]
MIVRRLNELPDDRVVSGETWISRRLLLRDEGMGFSLHDTLIKAGTRTEMHYANHLESVYCIEGEGTVTVVGSGEVIKIEPGTVYALDQHDKHLLEARTQLRMVCVFNPPLAGPEVHDATGAYPLID